MTESAALPRSKRLIYISILLLLAFVGTAWTVSSSLASAAPSTNITPTRGPSYGMVEIIKPTYTATTLPSPTPETPSPTASLSVDKVTLPIDTSLVALAEIVEDTPVPEYSAPVVEEGGQQAPAYGGNKYILVDISEQHMYVYEGETLVYSFVSSTGMYNATRVGTFSVLDKIPSAYGATWDIWMPNWLGIYWAGSLENGIHALPILPNGAQLWAGYLGTPISYGCVVLGAYESQLLYDWAEVGTPVEIQW